MRSLGRFLSFGGLASLSWSVALGLVSAQALAQPSKDNASPPIEVPTAPVPQGMQPPPPPPAAKPQPKPAAGPAAPKPAPSADKPKEQPAAGDDGEKKTPTYNNEGTFKISGSKGSGAVGGSTKKPAGGAGPAPTGGGGGKSTGGGKGKPAAAASAANVAQWPGFHMTEDGGSEVIVEFSKATNAPSEHKAAGSVTYVFKGPVVAKANNKNPLITLHFNTPVASARLSSAKGELRLVIDMRAGVDSAGTSGMRAASEGGTGQQFFVKFPAGSFLPKNADSEEMPPPPTQKLKDKGKKGGADGEKSEEPEKKPEPKTKGGSKTGPSAE